MTPLKPLYLSTCIFYVKVRLQENHRYTISSYFALLLLIALTSCENGILPLMLIISSVLAAVTIVTVMKRRVLIGSRMKGQKRGCDRQLTQRTDTTNLATVKTS